MIPAAVSADLFKTVRGDYFSAYKFTESVPFFRAARFESADAQYGFIVASRFFVRKTHSPAVLRTFRADCVSTDRQRDFCIFGFKRIDNGSHILRKLRTVALSFVEADAQDVMRSEFKA